MKPIFTEVMDGVALPKPWQPTHMKSYAKGRPPFRVWTKMTTNREARYDQARVVTERHQKMNALLRKIARETGYTVKEIREYVITHSANIFSSKA